jgi:hypothetical protein
MVVTRQDAIRNQLDSAIWIWFNELDPISAHTLACSALKVAHDLGKKFGKGAALFDLLPKHLHKQAIEAQGFFKHAHSDPHKVLDFNTGLTQHHIFDAVTLYEKLYRKPTRLMTIFLIRFALVHPTVSTVKGLPDSFDKAAFAKLKNKAFFQAITPLIK